MTLVGAMANEAQDAIAAMQNAARQARALHARSELMRHMATTARAALAGGRADPAGAVAREWMQAWALDGTAIDAAARGFVDAHLLAAAGDDTTLAPALAALDAALAAVGTTLADEMAWRSECAHAWWALVAPPPPGIAPRGTVPANDPSRPFWDGGAAAHCGA